MNYTERVELEKEQRTTEDLIVVLRQDAVGSDDKQIMLEAAARLEELQEDLIKALTS